MKIFIKTTNIKLTPVLQNILKKS